MKEIPPAAHKTRQIHRVLIFVYFLRSGRTAGNSMSAAESACNLKAKALPEAAGAVQSWQLGRFSQDPGRSVITSLPPQNELLD